MDRARTNFDKELTNDVIVNLNELNINVDDFYPLCREFFNILLKSKLYMINGSLTGYFENKDVNNFIKIFKKFSTDKDLSKEMRQKVFDLITFCYRMAATEDEMNGFTSRLDRNTDFSKGGYYGKYYVCNYIPDATIKEIKIKALG